MQCSNATGITFNAVRVMHGCQKTKPVTYRERHKAATPYIRKTKHREDLRKEYS